MAGQQLQAVVMGLQSPPPLRQWRAWESLLPTTHGKWALWAPAFPILVRVHTRGVHRVSTHVSASLSWSPPMPPLASLTFTLNSTPCCHHCQHGLCLLRPSPHHPQHHQPPSLFCTWSPCPAPSPVPSDGGGPSASPVPLDPVHPSGLQNTDGEPTMSRTALAHMNFISGGEDMLMIDCVRDAFRQMETEQRSEY